MVRRPRRATRSYTRVPCTTLFRSGGARGVGLSVAEVMAANDARVLLLDVDQARLETCRDQFADRGLSLDIATVDVADIQALQAVIHDTAERHGRLDAVYANAGISAGRDRKSTRLNSSH